MTALVVTPRHLAGELAQTVDARELHAFFEVGTSFKDWIARRIEVYDFREGEDFCSFLSESLGGRPAREYALSMPMAKELAMVERGAKGKEARAYFLECERRSKAATHRIQNLPADLDARLERIEQQVALQTPKALPFERLTDQRGAVCTRESAKLLDQKPHKFQAWLVAARWIFRAGEHGGMQAFQCRIDQGVLIHRMVEMEHTSSFASIRPQVLVTSKGLAKLASILEPLSNIRQNPRPRPARSINRS